MALWHFQNIAESIHEMLGVWLRQWHEFGAWIYSAIVPTPFFSRLGSRSNFPFNFSLRDFFKSLLKRNKPWTKPTSHAVNHNITNFDLKLKNSLLNGFNKRCECGTCVEPLFFTLLQWKWIGTRAVKIQKGQKKSIIKSPHTTLTLYSNFSDTS